jgi:hypothetical protein
MESKMPLMNTSPNSETPLDDAAPEKAVVIPMNTNDAKPRHKGGTKGTPGNPETATDKPSRHTESKADRVVTKLRGAKGATVATLMQATGWQAHSVRGFLSGTVKKKLGLTLVSEIGKDGVRRYRIAGQAE